MLTASRLSLRMAATLVMIVGIPASASAVTPGAHVVGTGRFTGKTSQHHTIEFHVAKGTSASCQYAHGKDKAHRDCLYDPNSTDVEMHCPTVGTATLYSGFNANAKLISTRGKLSETNKSYSSGTKPVAIEKIHVTIRKSEARGELSLKETVENSNGGTETCHSGTVRFTVHRE